MALELGLAQDQGSKQVVLGRLQAVLALVQAQVKELDLELAQELQELLRELDLELALQAQELLLELLELARELDPELELELDLGAQLALGLAALRELEVELAQAAAELALRQPLSYRLELD